MYDPYHIWWEEITGPKRLVDAVCDTLSAGQSLLLVTGSAFPWRWAFQDNVETVLGRRGIQLFPIDCTEDYDGGDIIGLLLQHAAPAEIPAYLRCLDHHSAWLKKSGALRQKAFWLKGIPTQYQGPLLKFVRDYHSASVEEGMFVLELEEGPAQLSKKLEALQYCDFVSQMDLQLFCWLLADKHHVPEELRAYAAGLVANLCIKDGEVAELLFQRINFESDDPLAVLADCCRNDFPEDWGALSVAGQEPHPFQLIREGNRALLIRRIWKAQLQIAFPRIEVERLRLIERYRDRLQEALSQEYWDPERWDRVLKQFGRPVKHIVQFSKAVKDPYELELGTLGYMMMKLKKIEDKSTPALSFMEAADQRRLGFLLDMRNQLAHMYDDKNCTPQEMRQIISYTP